MHESEALDGFGDVHEFVQMRAGKLVSPRLMSLMRFDQSYSKALKDAQARFSEIDDD